ncbi:MAG TPA: FAD-dependent oxidoreductase, partial [Kiritimatiellia bacterium]
ERPAGQPWPYWPMKLRTSTSHDEGAERLFAISTKEFTGQDGHVTKLKTVNVRFEPPQNGGGPKLVEVPGTEKEYPADLVLLAMGFLGPETDTVVKQLGCEVDARGNVKTAPNGYATSVPNVFVAGDARRGQSLIVWAISEGRECARAVDLRLMGTSELPTKVGSDLPRV